MKERFSNVLISLLTATVLGLTSVSMVLAGGHTAEEVVRLLNAKWDESFNKGDAAAVAALYAEDSRVVTGDGNVVDGKADIQALFQGFIDSGATNHKLEMIDVKESGDIVWETAKWSLTGGDKKEYGGKVVNIYQKQSDGGLKAHLHIWN